MNIKISLVWIEEYIAENRKHGYEVPFHEIVVAYFNGKMTGDERVAVYREVYTEPISFKVQSLERHRQKMLSRAYEYTAQLLHDALANRAGGSP